MTEIATAGLREKLNDIHKTIRIITLVIDHPEVYFATPTQKEEELAKKEFEKSYRHYVETGKIKVPRGIDSFSGKVRYIGDNLEFEKTLMNPSLTRVTPTGLVMNYDEGLLYKRQKSVERLMNLSPEEISELKTKAAKSNRFK